jgi:hypothetical protein
MMMLPALMQLSFDPAKHLAPVPVISGSSGVFAASTALCVRTLPEFLDLARR